MISFSLGNISVPTSQVSDFVIHEQIDRLPYGKIIIIDRNGKLVDDISLMNDVVITVNIVDGVHAALYSMYVYDYQLVPQEYGYDIECDIIMYSENMKHYTLIKPSIGIKNSKSIKAISEIMSRLGIEYEKEPGVDSSDTMDWLIVNSNMQSAIDHILSRSYINDSDALIAACDVYGKIFVTSVLGSLGSPDTIISHSYGSFGSQNGNSKDSLKISNYNIRNGAASRNAVLNGNMIKTVSDFSDGNVLASGDKFIEADTTDSAGTTGRPMKQQILSHDIVYKHSANVHKNYWKSRQVRSGVLGMCSQVLECNGSFEAMTRLGKSSTINLLSGSDGGALHPSSYSGIYMLIRKSVSYNAMSSAVSCGYSFVKPDVRSNKEAVRKVYGA